MQTDDMINIICKILKPKKDGTWFDGWTVPCLHMNKIMFICALYINVISYSNVFPPCCLVIWYANHSFIVLYSQLNKTVISLTLARFCTVFFCTLRYEILGGNGPIQHIVTLVYFTIWAAFIWWHWIADLNVKQFTILNIFFGPSTT